MGLSYQVIPGIDIDTDFSYKKNEYSDSKNKREPDFNDSEDDLQLFPVRIHSRDRHGPSKKDV